MSVPLFLVQQRLLSKISIGLALPASLQRFRPGSRSLQPKQGDDQAAEEIGSKIHSAHESTRNEGLVEFITDAEEKTDGNCCKCCFSRALPLHVCAVGENHRCSQNTVDAKMCRLVQPRNSGHVQRGSRLMGEKKNSPHDSNHGD